MSNHSEADIAAKPLSFEEAEHIVVMERLHRYNCGLPCGVGALRQHLREQARLHPLPSARRIGRILCDYGLTHGRTGWHEGENVDWLPAASRVPQSQRKCFSMIENGKNR
jgi:hypothetical protein